MISPNQFATYDARKGAKLNMRIIDFKQPGVGSKVLGNRSPLCELQSAKSAMGGYSKNLK
jgi:hypothetical protein